MVDTKPVIDDPQSRQTRKTLGQLDCTQDQ